MKTLVRTLVVSSLSVVIPSVAAAQSAGFSASDSKELASYRLTMETTKKVQTAMRALFQEMSRDPRFQALQKTKAEIETLSKKEEPTEAESERLEKLQTLAEQQEEALEKGNGPNMNTAQNLNEMEAAIKANPRFAAALSAAGLPPREYSKYMLASLMAGMVAGFQKSGMLKELPADLKEVHPDNVKFIIEHEAELNEMRKEFEKLGKS